MKKLILLLTIAYVFSASASQAQSMIGGRIGINIGNASVSPAPNNVTFSSTAGILIGGQFDTWFSNSWALSLGLDYVQKGSSISANGTDGTATATEVQAVNYLEVPVLIKYAIIQGDIQPYIFAGPSLGVNLSASYTYQGTTTSNSSDYTSMDLSLFFGAGLCVKVGGPSVFLDAGYALGLTNIDATTTTGSVSATTSTTKTNDIRIAAGMLFPL